MLTFATRVLAAAGGVAADHASDRAGDRPAGLLATIRLELDAASGGSLAISPGRTDAAAEVPVAATAVRRGAGDLHLWIRYDALGDRLDATVSSDRGDFSAAAEQVVAQGFDSVDPLRFRAVVQGYVLEIANRGTAGALALRDLELATSGRFQRLRAVGAGPLRTLRQLQVDRRMAGGFQLVGTIDGASMQPAADGSLALELDLFAQASAAPQVEAAHSITIVDQSPAVPYPSTYFLSGLPSSSTVGKCTITLTGLSHTFPGDIDMLFVTPSGQNVMVMSDACSTYDLVNANLVFDDYASDFMTSSPCTLATYRPTNIGSGDTFPPPAPAAPFGRALGNLQGGSLNGTWQLWVRDGGFGDSGSISDWSFQCVEGVLGEIFLDDFETGDTLRWSSEVL